MATKPTDSWNETYPAGTTKINQGDDAQRQIKTSVREIMAADHKWESSGQDTDWGYHNQVTLIEAADIGTGAEGYTILGNQTVSAKGELVYTDEDDSDVQITSSGYINTSALKPGVVATVALDNLSSVAINTSLLPGTDDSIDLGSSSKQWKDIYFDDNIVANGTTVTAAQVGSLASVTNQVVQIKNTQTGAVSTGATAFPNDDTIPQITEGNEFMTLAITPKSATNLLVIEVVANLNNPSGNPLQGALFQDTTANALIASATSEEATSLMEQMVLKYYMTAGTTSATTFKFRAGGSSGTITFNGVNGSRKYGGVALSSITITEYSA